MQINNQTLPARRHPEVVSKAGSFTSQAQDYAPPAELDAGLIAGHPWGVRTISLVREQTQYMVYDKLGRNVLSCCPTPEQAARFAIDRLKREAIPPHSYSRRLAGMTFGSRSVEGSHLLHHTVLDESGVLVAESTDGRASAAAEAVRAIVSRVDCRDASQEEFATTVVFALVRRGASRSSLPLLYDNALNDGGQDAVAAALRAIWRADPLLQQDSYGNEILRGSSDMKTFVGNAHASLLRFAGRSSGDIAQVDFTYQDESRVQRIVFHRGHLSRQAMLQAMYRSYQEESEDCLAEQVRSAYPAQ